MNLKARYIMYYVGILTILSSFLIIFTVAYWLFYPYKVLDAVVQPAFDKPSYAPGDMMVYTNDYCKFINLPATVTVEFIDGVVYALPSFQTNVAVGCHKLNGTIPVPNLPPGNYRIKVIYNYKVNPIRHFVYEYETQSFTIVKPTE